MDAAGTVGEGFTEKVTGELGLKERLGVYQMEKNRRRSIIGEVRARKSKVCSESGAQCSSSLGCVGELPPPANIY